MINFRDMLLTLVKSGEDFSDHGMRVDVNGELGPLHDMRKCGFCDAWRAALFHLSHPPKAQFMSDDEVLICGRTPGVVVETRTQVKIRLSKNGVSAAGWFDDEFVSLAAGPERTHWSDRQGDIWERDEATMKAFVVEYADGKPVDSLEHLKATDPSSWYYTFEQAQKAYGRMTQVKR